MNESAAEQLSPRTRALLINIKHAREETSFTYIRSIPSLMVDMNSILLLF